MKCEKMARKFPLETSTAFSNLLVRIVYRFNILLGGCGICIDLKFSEAISRSCVLCSFRVIQTYVVNFICQKVQTFWADSDSLGKINDKKIFKKFFFQCLALPKDPQSFGSQNLRCPFLVSQYYRRRRLCAAK